MQNHLADSTAMYGAGNCTGKRVFEITTGQFAGRVVVLMHTSPSEIKMTYADYPYSAWATPFNLVNDSADSPFDATMDDDNNLYLVYTLEADKTLVCRKIGFVQGIWLVDTYHTIFDADINRRPSISIQPTGRLWAAWSRESGGVHYINVKHSDDGGDSWGSGPSDAGYEIASGLSSVYPRLQMMGSYIYLLYAVDGARLSYRRKHVNLDIWESEADISTGAGYDDNFDSAASDDGRLGVVFDNGAVCFREYDGDRWGGVAVIDANGGEFPQLRYFDNAPHVVYLSDFVGGSHRVLYSLGQSGDFSAPLTLDPPASTFDRFFCYNAGRAVYQDLTSEAADDTPGDICFPETAALLQSPGDAVYAGMENRFHYLKIILSTAGAGGIVSWQYYNGTDWVAFTPSGGAFNFDQPETELLLWDDLDSVPDNWQKNFIEGSRLFWIRVVVISAYDTDPVGTYAGSVSNAGSIVLMEN